MLVWINYEGVTEERLKGYRFGSGGRQTMTFVNIVFIWYSTRINWTVNTQNKSEHKHCFRLNLTYSNMFGKGALRECFRIIRVFWWVGDALLWTITFNVFWVQNGHSKACEAHLPFIARVRMSAFQLGWRFLLATMFQILRKALMYVASECQRFFERIRK